MLASFTKSRLHDRPIALLVLAIYACSLSSSSDASSSTGNASFVVQYSTQWQCVAINGDNSFIDKHIGQRCGGLLDISNKYLAAYFFLSSEIEIYGHDNQGNIYMALRFRSAKPVLHGELSGDSFVFCDDTSIYLCDITLKKPQFVVDHRHKADYDDKIWVTYDPDTREIYYSDGHKILRVNQDSKIVEKIGVAGMRPSFKAGRLIYSKLNNDKLDRIWVRDLKTGKEKSYGPDNLWFEYGWQSESNQAFFLLPKRRSLIEMIRKGFLNELFAEISCIPWEIILVDAQYRTIDKYPLDQAPVAVFPVSNDNPFISKHVELLPNASPAD